jgi:hypothetical protein
VIAGDDRVLLTVPLCARLISTERGLAPGQRAERAPGEGHVSTTQRAMRTLRARSSSIGTSVAHPATSRRLSSSTPAAWEVTSAGDRGTAGYGRGLIWGMAAIIIPVVHYRGLVAGGRSWSKRSASPNTQPTRLTTVHPVCRTDRRPSAARARPAHRGLDVDIGRRSSASLWTRSTRCAAEPVADRHAQPRRPPDHPKIAAEGDRRRPAELARPVRRQGTRLE